MTAGEQIMLHEYRCGRTGRSGFTIIEIMLVVLIIGILAAVSIVSMVNSIHGSRLTSAATAIIKAGKYSRSMAIMNQQEVRLMFHKNEARIEARGPSGVKLNRRLEGVKIDSIVIGDSLPPAGDDTWTVTYLRNGRCTPYSVTVALEDSSDKPMTIDVNAFSEARTKEGY